MKIGLYSYGFKWHFPEKVDGGSTQWPAAELAFGQEPARRWWSYYTTPSLSDDKITPGNDFRIVFRTRPGPRDSFDVKNTQGINIFGDFTSVFRRTVLFEQLKWRRTDPKNSQKPVRLLYDLYGFCFNRTFTSLLESNPYH